MAIKDSEVDKVTSETFEKVLEYAKNEKYYYNNNNKRYITVENDKFYFYDNKYNKLICYKSFVDVKNDCLECVQFLCDKKTLPKSATFTFISKFITEYMDKFDDDDKDKHLSINEITNLTLDDINYYDKYYAYYLTIQRDEYLRYLELLNKYEENEKKEKQRLQEEANKSKALDKENRKRLKEERKLKKALKNTERTKRNNEKKELDAIEKELEQIEQLDPEREDTMSSILDFENLEYIVPQDIPTNDNLRKVFMTNKFVSQMNSNYAKNKELYNEIKLVLDNFSTNSPKELEDFLKSRTCKKFTAVSDNIYKIYVNGTSGNRLLFAIGNDLKNIKYENSIICLSFVVRHDDQTKEAQNIKLKELNDLNEYLKSLDTTTPAPITKYVKNPHFRFKYVLSSDQEKYVSVKAPTLIKGNAGAGKTVISFELFDKLTSSNELTTYYLTFNDYLVRYAKNYLKDEVVKDGSCIVTTSNFLIKYLNKKPDNYIDYNKFKLWLHSDLEIKRYDIENIKTYILWTFIRGIIKGKYNNNNLSYLSRIEFIEYVSNNEPKYLNEADKIYKCFELYQKYLSSNSYFDDNDLATLIIKNKAQEDYYFIIDEVQDLTERLLYSLTHMVNNNLVFMFGDPNQTIQPTIIDLNSLQSLFKDNSISYENYSKHQLLTSFRSGREILRFINHLQKLRQLYIAKSDSEDDLEFESNRNDDLNLCTIKCIGNKDLNDSILKEVLNSSNTKIIVSSDEAKKELISKNKLFENFVNTIEDVKGLEHDNIIIYNFINDNKDLIESILNGFGKKDTFSRTVFNRLYVAATRARNRIALLEDCDNLIVNKFYSDISEKKTLSDVTLYLGLTNNKEDWLRNAIDYKLNYEFNTARFSYEQINQEHVYDNEILLCQILESIYSKVNDNKIPLKERLDYLLNNADVLLNNLEYDFIYDTLTTLHLNGATYPDLYYYVKSCKNIEWSKEDLVNISKLNSLKYLSKNVNFIYKTYVLPQLEMQKDIMNKILKECEK